MVRSKFYASCSSRKCTDAQTNCEKWREKRAWKMYYVSIWNSHVAALNLNNGLLFPRFASQSFRCMRMEGASRSREKENSGNFVIFTNRVLFAVSFHHHRSMLLLPVLLHFHRICCGVRAREGHRDNGLKLTAHMKMNASLFGREKVNEREQTKYEVVFLVRAPLRAIISGGERTKRAIYSK